MLQAAASLFSRVAGAVTNYGTSDTKKAEEQEPLIDVDQRAQSAARKSLKEPLEAQPPVKEGGIPPTEKRTFARAKPSKTNERTILAGKQRIYKGGTIDLRDEVKDKEFKDDKRIEERDKYEFHKDKKGNTLFKTEKGYVKLQDEQTGRVVHRDLEFITNSSRKEVSEIRTGDSAQESFENKANILAHADRTAMDKLSSRFSKFTLALKRLGTDLVYAPLRLLNVPVQFTMAAILAGQGLYRRFNPSQGSNAFTHEDYAKKSKIALIQGFVSAGAAVVPLIGNTIGLVTAPAFNTKHFTGSLGIRATKLLGVFHLKIMQGESSKFVTDVLRRSNNPKMVYEGLKNDSSEKPTLSEKFKSLFIIKGKVYVKDKDAFTLKAKAQDEIYKGGYFYHIARTFNAMALHSFKELGLVLGYGMSPDDPSNESYVKMRKRVINQGKHRPRTMSEKERTRKEQRMSRVAGVTKKRDAQMTAQSKHANEISQQDK